MKIKKGLFHLWRLLLYPIFIFILIHFLKDITQDILKISSPLDVFGDAHEDLSFLPQLIPFLFSYGLGALSFIVEAFLLIAIPITLKRKQFSVLEKLVLAGVIFLLMFLTTCYLLDPRYKPIKKQTTYVQSPSFSKNIIISTDNASTAKYFSLFAAEPDDSLALVLLLKAHQDNKINILGITSSFGNTNNQTSFQITQKQIELSGLDIPVIKGADYKNQANSNAVKFITNTLGQSDQPVTLIALGPVTDFAAVFKQKPELKDKVSQFFLIRSGPYLIKKYWYLFSFNALKDINSAKFMYKFGANQYTMGKEIFSISLNNELINQLLSVNHPMMRYIAKDLRLWNLQNKLLPIHGYLKRKGNMCPWDLVWTMYLIQPELFNLEKTNDNLTLHIKDTKSFITHAVNYLQSWGE